jgi:hypothetical protein
MFCNTEALIICGFTFLQDTGWQAKALWEIITMLPPAAIYLLVQKVPLKTMDT